MKKMNIGERFKQLYEEPHQMKLTRHIPVIIRVDGKNFHNLNLEKPFDRDFSDLMISVASSTMGKMQGAVCVYHQSDEVSFLLWDWQHHSSEAWFDYNKSKLETITASLFTAYFNKGFWGKPCAFDARAFGVPKDEVPNYFIWRQRDCIRNSISMFARHYFSQHEIQGLNNTQLREKLWDNQTPWEDLPTIFRFGQLAMAGDILVSSRRMGYEGWSEHTKAHLITEKN